MMTDYDYDKKMSVVLTLVFLLPPIYRMIMKISVANFCNYLAIVNFVAYNFGYHVHEKAI